MKNNTDITAMRVLVIEDEAMVRITLVETLRHLGIKFVASASDAFSALKAGQEFKPDAIFCDIDLGAGPHGIDIAHALRSANPKLGVIFLSTLDDPRLKSASVRGLPAGSIYLKKGEVNRSNMLLDTLISLLSNNGESNAEAKSRIKLTEIQIEILQLVASGLSNAEIAKIRGITIKSTENAIARLAKVLKVKDKADANQRVLLTRLYFELSGKITKIS